MPATLLPPPTSRLRRAASAVLRSPVGSVLDDLVGPHGLDRYLELVDPLFARDVVRAVVTDVRRETHDTTTLTLRPRRWDGHVAGQYVQLTVEVDGRRQTRCYSVSSSAHRADGQFTVTVKRDPDGIVSPHLVDRIGRGSIVELGEPEGDFTLPAERPDEVLLVSGGSGITPVISMARTLVDEAAATRVTFLHYARTTADVPFAGELRALDALERVDVHVVFTGEDATPAHGLAGHVDESHLEAVLGDRRDVPTFVCGPASLIDAVTALAATSPHLGDVAVERFQLATTAPVDPDTATGQLTFADSRVTVDSDGATVLAQAEAAGLTPQAGCRMGICHTCIRPKLAGQVRDVRDGRLSSCDPEDVQICVSAPVGDVTIDL